MSYPFPLPGLRDVEDVDPIAEANVHATAPSPVSGLIAALFPGSGNLFQKPVLFAAIEPQAGVTWVASAVAAELAASGHKVLLAEAEVIASLAPTEDVVALCDRVGPDKAWVLGREEAKRTRYSLSSSRGRPSVTLSALQEEFPYILLDAPPLSASDVALRLVSLTAGSVLVIRKSRTEKRTLVEACKRFDTVGGQVLGCVYNAYE